MNLHSTLKSKKNLKNLEISVYIAFFIAIIMLFCIIFNYYIGVSKENMKNKYMNFSKDAILNIETKRLYMNFNGIDSDQVYYGINNKEGSLVNIKDIKMDNGRYTLLNVYTNNEDEIYDCTGKVSVVATSNLSKDDLKNIKVDISGNPVKNNNVTYTLDELEHKKVIDLEFNGISSTISESVLVEVYKKDKTKLDGKSVVEVHFNKVNGEKGFSCKSR